MAAPTPVFDGTKLPVDFGPKNYKPFAEYQHPTDYIPDGLTSADTQGLDLVTIPGYNHKWIQLWVNDNGFYAINHVANDPTCRAQLKTPPSPGGAFDPGETCWVVLRCRHDIPALKILWPKVTEGPLSGPPLAPAGGWVNTQAGLYASHGPLSIFGQPFNGSGPNNMDAAGNSFKMVNANGSKTTIGQWTYDFPAGETVNLARRIHLSSAWNKNDAWQEIWASKGDNPLQRQKIKLTNGQLVDRISGYCTLTDANHTGPQSFAIGNYHRWGMFTGKHSVWVYGPWVYLDSDVPNVTAIDPYTLAGGSTPTVPAPVEAATIGPAVVGKPTHMDGSGSSGSNLKHTWGID